MLILILALDTHFDPYKDIFSLQVRQFAGVNMHVLQLFEHFIHLDACKSS